MMQFHGRRRIEGNIDMTPMIDTLLQLFMIFLLQASFVASAVRLDLPRASASQQREPPKSTLIALDAENRMSFNGEIIAPSELQHRLHAVLLKDNKQPVILRADQALPYKHVLKTMVEIQRAGASNVHLAYEDERTK